MANLWKSAAAGLLLSFWINSWAVVDISGLSDIDFGAWSPGSGVLVANEDFCVAERRGSSANDGPYQVMVAPLVGRTFNLLSVTDPTVSIPAVITFQDLLSNLSEPLVPLVFSPREMTGFANCIGANNARLVVTLASTDVAAVPPGEYESLFRFSGRGTANRILSDDFWVRIQSRPLIRISGLDPIDLGRFDGTNDLRGRDDFCVFSNSPSGTYTLTVTGQGSGGDFLVASGAAQIPLDVEIDDGTGFVPVTPNAPLPQDNASSDGIDCGGSSNAAVRVSARSADLVDAAAGVYSGELTLMVSPI